MMECQTILVLLQQETAEADNWNPATYVDNLHTAPEITITSTKQLQLIYHSVIPVNENGNIR